MSFEVSCRTPHSWDNLPLDILLQIANRLDFTSTIRLSAVRTSWASKIRPRLAPTPPFNPNQRIPWLLIAPVKSKTGPEFGSESESEPSCTNLMFYDLITKNTYSIPTSIPFLRAHHWWGSNKGWVVTVDRQSNLHLIKPLTGAHVPLPVDTGRDRPWKVILCRTPDSGDGFLAVTMNGYGRLVYTAADIPCWVPLTTCGPFLDAVFHREKLYLLLSDALWCWDFQGSYLRDEWGVDVKVNKKRNWWTKHLWKRRHDISFQPWTKYLVEWRGTLLMVCSNKEPWTRLENHKFCRIKLYKLDIDSCDRRWERVKSLGSDALFLGANCSYVVSTGGSGTGTGNVRGNRIYITDQSWHCFPHHNNFQSQCAFGVYDLKKKSYKPCRLSDASSYLIPPIWFRPC